MHTLTATGLSTRQSKKVGTPAHTWRFESKKAGDLALAVFLLLVCQQLINKLPDHLLGRSIQHREHVHDQGVDIPFANRRKVKES